MPAWVEWRDQIIQAAIAATDEADLAKRLGEWAAQATSDEALEQSHIAGSIYEAAVHADMGGQLFVRQVEVPESGEQSRSLAAGVVDPFLRLPFDDALAYFLAKRIITPEQFRQLSDAARNRAFTATRLASDALVQRCRDLLAESIASGDGLREFRRGMLDGSLSLGIEPASPAYLENVYRTNVASAYGAGRYRQITSDAVRAARPFVEYRATRDSRTRPHHAELHGAIFSQDDPDWHRYAPPNGYQCRCTMVARRAEDIDPARIVRAADIEWTPDFDAPPTLADAG